MQAHSGGGAENPGLSDSKTHAPLRSWGRKVGDGKDSGWEVSLEEVGSRRGQSSQGKEVLLEKGAAQQGVKLLGSAVLGVSERWPGS